MTRIREEEDCLVQGQIKAFNMFNRIEITRFNI